jgi:hypothetical protein
LENNKWLIHVSNIREQDIDDLFTECILLYEFAQLNNPLSVVECIYGPVDDFEIDARVKRFMKLYGIENVRGGSYSANYIPYPYLQTLEHELEKKKIKEATRFLERIRTMYHQQDPAFLNQEKNKLVNSLEKYLEKQTGYTFLLTSILENDEDASYAKTVRKAINRMFEWVEYYLRRFELQEPIVETKKEIAEQYKIFLSFYRRMLGVFQKMPNVEKNTTLLPVIIAHPEFAFDLFFYHSKPSDVKKYTQPFKEAKELFYYFEYMKNSIFNRMEEYEFDLLEFDSHFEMETRIHIDYIDYLLTER